MIKLINNIIYIINIIYHYIIIVVYSILTINKNIYNKILIIIIIGYKDQ
jgi:hypothetical protein